MMNKTLIDRINEDFDSTMSYEGLCKIFDTTSNYDISPKEFNEVISIIDSKIGEEYALECVLSFADWYHRTNGPNSYDSWKNLKKNIGPISSKLETYLSITG